MTTRVAEGARRERHSGCRPRFSLLAASPLNARACTPLTKSEEKERLLARSLHTNYPDSGSASDWPCHVENSLQPRRYPDLGARHRYTDDIQYDYTPDYSICFSTALKDFEKKKILFLNSEVLYMIIQLIVHVVTCHTRCEYSTDIA